MFQGECEVEHSGVCMMGKVSEKTYIYNANQNIPSTVALGSVLTAGAARTKAQPTRAARILERIILNRVEERLDGQVSTRTGRGKKKER